MPRWITEDEGSEFAPGRRKRRLPERPEPVNTDKLRDHSGKPMTSARQAIEIMRKNEPVHFYGRLAAFNGDERRFITATFGTGKRDLEWEDEDPDYWYIPPITLPTPQQMQTFRRQVGGLCDGLGGDDLRQCYIDQLAMYGVEVIDSIQALPGGISGAAPGDFDQFSAEQLAVVLSGVQRTGAKLAGYIEEITGQTVTSAEAFELTLGRVVFVYDDDRNGFGVTLRIEDPSIASNPMYIVLDDDSFDATIAGGYEFGDLAPEFVVVHELGHVFHNRYRSPDPNNAPIETEGYATATGATYYPFGGTWMSPELADIPLLPLRNDDGTLATRNDQQIYAIPAGFFVEGDYLNTGERYFPNETRNDGANPKEGFADTFANLMLDPRIFGRDELRAEYFRRDINDWITQIILNNLRRDT